MKRPKTSTIFRYYNENWKVPLAFLLGQMGLDYYKVENFGIFAILFIVGSFLSQICLYQVFFFDLDKFLRREFQKVLKRVC